MYSTINGKAKERESERENWGAQVSTTHIFKFLLPIGWLGVFLFYHVLSNSSLRTKSHENLELSGKHYTKKK